MIFHTKIAGVTFVDRQRTVSRLNRCGELDTGTELVLRREPNNQFDHNAIAVFTKSGEQLGYIPRDTAKSMALNMDRGQDYKAYVTALTGGDAGSNYGVNIQIQG